MKLSYEAAGKYIVLASLLGIVLLAGRATAAEKGQEKAPVLDAEKWLALVDSGKFTDSWNASAQALKTRISRMHWVQKLHAEREPKGACISRKFISSQYRDYPPGSDKEERVIIRFDTSF